MALINDYRTSGGTDDSTTDDSTDTVETTSTDTETASGDNLIDATADYFSDASGEQRDDTISDATTVTADEETVSDYELTHDPVQTSTGTATVEGDQTTESGDDTYETTTGDATNTTPEEQDPVALIMADVEAINERLRDEGVAVGEPIDIAGLQFEPVLLAGLALVAVAGYKTVGG